MSNDQGKKLSNFNLLCWLNLMIPATQKFTSLTCMDKDISLSLSPKQEMDKALRTSSCKTNTEATCKDRPLKSLFESAPLICL